MEAGETHLDMLAKPNAEGVVVVRQRSKGEKKNGSEWGVVGTTSSQRHLVPTWQNCIPRRRLALWPLDGGEVACWTD